MKSIKFPAISAALLFVSTIFVFQNCAEQNHSFSASTVSQKYGNINCLSFSGDSIGEDCHQSTNGLIGNLYHLLDKTDGSTIPANMYDKNGVAIAFPSALNSVNTVIERGLKMPTYILMPKVSVPSLYFSGGFRFNDDSLLRDGSGKILIEAFALDLKGKLQLAPGMASGNYEIAVLSDDGALLDLDFKTGRGLEPVVSNDGRHGTRLGCSSITVKLDESSKLPLRLRYFQGPRYSIALTIVMRKLSSGELAGYDPDCGVTSANWYGGATTDQGYVPDYKNSRFGALIARGWFVPTPEMYALPDSL